MEILRLWNVTKTYKMGDSEVNALSGVTLSIEKGKFVVIIGPSGSGKSTMMNLVGALDIPTSGSIYLGGNDISKMSESALSQLRGKKIGFIFQQFNLIPTLSALDNVAMPMIFQGIPVHEREMRARSLLESVGLGDRMHHKPNELSGGQQQRVAIARALANDPEMILADEPTGNLDTKTGEQVMEMLHLLRHQGKTIVMVTHDVDLVSHADLIIRLRDGAVESITKNSTGQSRQFSPFSGEH